MPNAFGLLMKGTLMELQNVLASPVPRDSFRVLPLSMLMGEGYKPCGLESWKLKL